MEFPQQSNSAIKRLARIENANQKSFGGKLTDFSDNRERHFNQRMLKAYLRGDNRFTFGLSEVANIYTGKREPLFHAVLLTDKSVDPKKLDALLAGGYTDPGKVFGGASNNKSEMRKTIAKRIKEKNKKKAMVLGSQKDIENFTKAK